jgi:hypothetical protein
VFIKYFFDENRLINSFFYTKKLQPNFLTNTLVTIIVASKQCIVCHDKWRIVCFIFKNKNKKMDDMSFVI